MRRRRRKNESGYALLLVFLMAAMIAISLYMEIPRVAFDAQRQKEDLLMYRGDQYKRAIEVFMRQNKRWPAKIEDLETTNGRHYLRRRYVDPMTGKDEWRAVHTNGMTLTDSKVQTQQQKKDEDKDTTAGQYVGTVAGLGQTLPNATGTPTPGGALANRRRDSDNRGPGGMGAGNPGDPNAPPGTGTMAGGTAGMPGMPGINGVPGQPIQGGVPGQPGQPGVPPIPGVPMPGMPPGAMPGQQPIGGRPPGTTGSNSANAGGSYLGGGGSYLGGGGSYLGGGAAPPSGNMPQGGQPGAGAYPPGMPVNSQTGGVSAQPGTYSTQFGAQPAPGGFQQPGTGMNPAANSAAAGMIQNLLTQPRPGGIPVGNTNGMQAMGGGIAGFASTVDQDSIMVYNDQTNYGLWEFVFDPNKIKQIPNPNGGTQAGTPAAQLGSNPGTPASQVGQPAGQQNSPFGQQQANPMQPQGGLGYGRQ